MVALVHGSLSLVADEAERVVEFEDDSVEEQDWLVSPQTYLSEVMIFVRCNG